MTTSTIEYIFFESVPADYFDSELGERVDMPPEFRKTLTALENQQDSARCARCDDAIGFALVSGYAREQLEWKPTGFARHPNGPVVALCEGCTPWLPDAE